MSKELILTFLIRKEKDRYSAWCQELDVVTEGDTVEEAKTNLKEAVQCHVETMVEQGDTALLLEKLGLTKTDLQKKKILVPEMLTGTFDIPIAV